MPEIEQIMSRDNRRLVHARKVRDGKIADEIFIEGRRLAVEALRSDLQIRAGLVADNFSDSGLVDQIVGRDIIVAQVPEKLLKSIADTNETQGIFLIASRPTGGHVAIMKASEKTAAPLVIFLDQIANPSNLGAVLRTAEAAGVAGVILSQNSADVYSTKALRSAMGSTFRLAIWDRAETAEVFDWAQMRGMVTTAAEVSGSIDHTKIDWKLPRLLIVGSEAHGISPEVATRVSEKIKIEMANNVESLNLAVSVGIILFEAKRQLSISV